MKQSIALGSMRLSLVLDERGSIDGNQVFYPATQEEWGVGLRPDASGQVPIVVNALLIRAGDDLTLVDTGFGEEEHPDRATSVIASLAALGVAPEQVARVILTHAHGDHILGNTLRRGEGWLPAFPAAEYIIQEQEIAAWRGPEDTVWQTRFQPLAERGQLRLLNGQTEVAPGIVCWPTPGHTVAHQSVLIRSQGRQALFVGDLAVLAKNLERLEWGHSWAWSLEVDVQSRRQVAEWAIANDALLILGHDPDQPWVKLARAGAGYRAVPLEP